jgi:hypothetical protein
MNKNQATRGRGRPKGSTSFVKIKLSDLTGHLGHNAPVMVSKKWLEQVGIMVDETEDVRKIKPVIEEEEKIQFNIS